MEVKGSQEETTIKCTDNASVDGTHYFVTITQGTTQG